MREHEHADVRVAATDLLRRDEAVVAVAGRHPDVHDRHVWSARLNHAEQSLRVAAPAHDLEAGILEHAREAFTQQRLVVGDHEAHGISTLSRPSHTAAVPPTAPTRSWICSHHAVGLVAGADHYAQSAVLGDSVDGHVVLGEPQRLDRAK